MVIRYRRPSESVRKSAEKLDDLPPPSIEQRIQATRVMGYVGGALFAGFLLTIGYSVFENSKTIPVDGTVVSISSDVSGTHNGTYDGSRLTSYWHKFRFTDRDGVEHIADSVGDGRDTAFQVGDVVSIGYYPDDATKVRVRSWFGLWKLQLLLSGLGLALIAFSIWSIKEIRNEEQPTD